MKRSKTKRRPTAKLCQRALIVTSILMTTILTTVLLLIAGPAVKSARADEKDDLIKAMQKRLDALEGQQPPAPAIPNPAQKYPRGHVDPPADVLAARHAAAKLRHDGRVARLPEALAPTFDAVALGWVGTIDDQGNCGSCWDVSATGVITDAYIKAGVWKNDGSTKASPQYVLDCGRNGGCNGDDAPTVLDMAKSKGLPTTQDYGPYTARPGNCHLNATTKLYGIADWGFCTPSQGQGIADTTDVKNCLVRWGTLSTAVAANSDWDNLGADGILPYRKLSPNAVNHDVAIVGWDDNKTVPGTTKKGAWKVKNQWGTSWGLKGYCWIGYGSHQICTEAAWVSVVSLPPPGPGPVPPGPTPVPPGPSPEPPLAGDITVTIPQGSKPGNYVAIAKTDLDAIRVKQAEIADILDRQEDDTGNEGVPPGFTTDPQIHEAIGASLTGADAGKYKRLLKRKAEHRLFMKLVARRMAKDPEGQKLLNEYKAGALPPGFLQNLADFLIKIMPAILQILALFGL